MKKIILFTALFVSTAFITTAQVREEFKFVIKGGFAQSNIYDSDDEDLALGEQKSLAIQKQEELEMQPTIDDSEISPAAFIFEH